MTSVITSAALCGHPALNGVEIHVVRLGVKEKELLARNYRAHWFPSPLHKTVKFNLQQLADSCTLAAANFYGDNEFHVTVKVNGKIKETHAYVYQAGIDRVNRLLPKLNDLTQPLTTDRGHVTFYDAVGLTLMNCSSTDIQTKINCEGSKEVNP